MLCINYINIIFINYNNVTIYHNYGRPKNSFCSSKFPWAREIISAEVTDSLGKRPPKGSPALR